MNWKILFPILLSVLSVSSKAQDAWDLQKCVEYAMQHNIQIKQQQLNEEVAANNLLQSKIVLAPNLNGSLNAFINSGRSINPVTYTYVTQQITTSNYSLNTSLTLFNGLRQLNTIDQNKLIANADHFQTEYTKNTTLLNLTQAYLQILLSQESARALDEQVKISIEQLDHTQKLFDAGTVAEGNLLKAQAQLASDSLNLVTAQNTLELNRLNLALLLQVEPATFSVKVPKISNNVPLMDNNTVDAIYQAALPQQPQVVSADYTLKSAKKAITIAKGYQSPTISLLGSLGSNSSSYKDLFTHVSDPFFTQLKNNFNQAVGISASFPIFNGWQVRTGINNAQVKYEQAKLNQQQVKDQLKQDIYRAYTDAKSAQQKFYASQKNEQSAQTNFQYAQSLFDLGAYNALDYSTAKTNLAVAQINTINAKYEYLFKLKVLDFYQGKPITLDQ